MIRRPPRSTLDRSSAASDVYKRQALGLATDEADDDGEDAKLKDLHEMVPDSPALIALLSLIHISEPTRPY